MKNKLKTILFISIPFIIVILIIEIILQLLYLPVLQDESYFFGFSGCPDYFQKTISENNRHIYRTNPQKDIQATSFDVDKPESIFRIFTLGGSATFGEPFGPAGSFSHWLKFRLNTLHPEQNFEVINCGRKGFGSTRVRNILDEIINYDPDLIVVYFGNNEIRDYHFHRTEINIEIRPLLNNCKKILDNSYIFRMIFHLFLKRHITSYGAETINKIVGFEKFNKDVFSGQIEYINNKRKILEAAHGGLWVPQIETVELLNEQILDSMLTQLNLADPILWSERIKSVFRYNVSHMIRKCKDKHIPIIFLTRAKNLYYSKDARILFEKFDNANKIITDVCLKQNVPCIVTLAALLNSMQDEIGYNAFMDIAHPTLWANQIIAKAITEKMLKLQLIPGFDSLNLTELERQLDQDERISRDGYPFNSQYYSLIGWQKLICLNAANDREAVQAEINLLANKAIALDSHNEKAYLLLGALSSITGDVESAKKVWEEMKLQYRNMN